MEIHPSNIDAMYFAFVAKFQGAFDRAKPWYTQIATQVPSTTRENRYPWMAKIPKLREWLGERVVHNVAARAFAIANRKFELTESVEEDDIEDDQLGVYNPLMEQMGDQAAKWPDDLVLPLLQNGHTTTAYDGQFFFDTDHPVNVDDASAGTWSNNFTSKPLTHDNYGDVRAKMSGIKGEDGRPLGIRPTLLVVPPALEDTAKRILVAETVPSTAGTASQTNIYRGTAELMVIPELAGADTTWFLLDNSKPLKPFIFQLRRAPRFRQLTNPTDGNVFWEGKLIYGVDARGNGGYGLPHLAARAIA